MNRPRFRFMRHSFVNCGSLAAVVAAVIGPLIACGLLFAAAEDKKPRREAWESFPEDPIVKAYAEQVKAGGLDASARDTLLAKVLPLLEAPESRRSVERLRRRIRDVMLNERATEPAALEAANTAAADWLLERALAKEVDPLVAVNEVLLVGEMRGTDGKPWAGATSRLATTAANSAAPLAVRAAALAGVARHVEAGATVPSEAVDSILAVAFAPPSGGAAGDWLTSRALGLLPTVMPRATPETAAKLAAVLGDASRTVDVRVRAAEALGRAATEESNARVVAALASIREVAIRGLEEDLDRASDDLFGQSLAADGIPAANGPGFTGGVAGFSPRRPNGFGGEATGGGAVAESPPIEPTVVEHNAWRLSALAASIQPGGKAGGLAAVAGDAMAQSKELAAKLRENATILHEWIHPPKEPTKGKKQAGAAVGFEDSTATEALPTKQELGQALREALDDLRATPQFDAPGGRAAASNSPPAGADPFNAP